MDTEHVTEKKWREWVRRYLPCEIAGTTCEFGGAAIAYLMTGSFAVAAVVATIGASAGYYAAAYTAAVRTTYSEHRHLPWLRRTVAANTLALRSIVIEFGPAEVIDTLLVRPIAFYLGPILFGGMIAGWIFAKLVADIGFYVLAIFSYERFRGLLAVRRTTAQRTVTQEVRHGSAATNTAV